MSSITVHPYVVVSVSDCIGSLQTDLVFYTLQTPKENVYHNTTSLLLRGATQKFPKFECRSLTT
jgi:hypothetical protein